MRLLYDCEGILLLSFKFDLWLVNLFDLIQENMGQAKQKCVLEQNFAKFRFFLNSVEYHLSSI